MICSALFRKYKCLKLHDIVNLQNLIVSYKAYNKELPENLQNLFTQCSDIHSYNTRSSKHQFHRKHQNTSQRAMTCVNQSINLWYNLPDDIKQLNSLSLFKSKYKTLCINKYENLVNN